MEFPNTPEEWLILVLVFLLGLILGMAAMAGGKWKQRYRDEVRQRQETEAERSRLESQLRAAEARTSTERIREERVRDERPTTPTA